MGDLRHNLSEQTVIGSNCKLELPLRTYGKVNFGAGCEIGQFSVIDDGSTISAGTKIGRFSYIGKNSQIGVDRYVEGQLSSNAFLPFMALHFPEVSGTAQIAQTSYHAEKHNPVSIGHDVLIGHSVEIQSGVKIGDGAIVQSGAVVTSDVPPYSVFSGAPAGKIAARFDAKTIERLMALKWWFLPVETLKQVRFDDVAVALDQLEAIVADQKTTMPSLHSSLETMPPEVSRLDAARAALKTAQDGRQVLDKTNMFLEMLSAKLESTNIGADIIAHLRAHHSALFTDYDSADADDIAVLNNKVQFVAALYGDRPDDSSPLGPSDYKKILRIFQSRH